MSENLQKRPKKSILKNSSSFDSVGQNSQASSTKEAKFDEMNILATLHPADKDYGHMKIDEPKTPYYSDKVDSLNPDELAEKIRIAATLPPKVLEEKDSESEEEDEELSPEERAKRREFLDKRKKHYNEFQAIQLAKKLMEEEEDDEDCDQDMPCSSKN